jgi:dTDP-4-dehydrorhamnose reductase
VRLLVLGSTGLLGQALMAEARSRGVEAVGAARSGADHEVDVGDAGALVALADETAPSAIVNCAAIVDLAACEAEPGEAYAVNARPAGVLAEWVREHGGGLVQVSTDHYWTGDGAEKHDESAPVRLINEYARTKFAGERLALTAPDALVVRTNVVGRRGWEARPTFAEWALEALESRRPMTLFEDFFTSSLDSGSCAAAVLDLLEVGAAGVVNVASSQVASKKGFVEALARAMGVGEPDATPGSVKGMSPPRAESLGLDVSRAQAQLGRPLPTLDETVNALVSTARERA